MRDLPSIIDVVCDSNLTARGRRNQVVEILHHGAAVQKCVKTKIRIDGIADHLSERVDSVSDGVGAAQCAEIIGGGIDGLVRSCAEGVTIVVMDVRGVADHLAQIVHAASEAVIRTV